MKRKHRILFYIEQQYYWPSLKPVYEEFIKDNNFDVSVMFGRNTKRYLYFFLFSKRSRMERRFQRSGISVTRDVRGYDAVFCGSQIKHPKRFGDALLCNLDHGPGIKTLRYRHFLKQPDTRYICFVEGQYRVDKFRKYGLDKIEEIYDVGLPKLDVFFNGCYKKEELIRTYNLDPGKKVILYAPSFKPTSIFMASEAIAALSKNYNVIFKLHPYSWTGKYAPHSQHRFIEKLHKKYPDFYLVPKYKHNIMPFLFLADTMISDGSSVINEFLSMEKCGIIIDMQQEKHFDGQPLLEDSGSEWLKDSFIHIKSMDQIESAVKEALNPSGQRAAQLKKDKNYIFSYTDGKSALRVKNKTEELLNKRRKNASS